MTSSVHYTYVFSQLGWFVYFVYKIYMYMGSKYYVLRVCLHNIFNVFHVHMTGCPAGSIAHV